MRYKIMILMILFCFLSCKKQKYKINDEIYQFKRSEQELSTEIVYDLIVNYLYPTKKQKEILLNKNISYAEASNYKTLYSRGAFELWADMYLGLDCDSLNTPSNLLTSSLASAETKLPCLIFGMKRNTQIFNRIYEDNKDVFFAVVDDSIAEDYGIDLIVNDLVVCFDSVINRPTYQLFFKQFENQLVGKFKEFAQEDYFGRPMYINGKIQYKPQNYDTWVYTFWHRRFKEGTLEISIKILREMQSRYPLRKEKYLYSFWKKRKGKQIKK